MITLVFIALFLPSVFPQDCNISLFDSWPSVVVWSNDLKITYPSLQNNADDRNISIPSHSSVIISCNGGRFNGNFASTKTIQATCNQDGRFEAQNIIFDFNEISCINFSPQIVVSTNVECSPGASLMEVGFQIGQNIEFLPQMAVCFDKENLTVLYTNHTLVKEIGFIKSYLSTNYVVDSVYDINVDFDMIYGNFTYQQSMINKLLNLSNDSTQFVDPLTCQRNPGVTTPGFCFSKRPLTYRGNFVYIPQHYATYRYINVVPQWYFLDYNLDKLERNIVDYVKQQKIDLSVYSGTLGVLNLPNSDGQNTEIYFYEDNGRKAIPVPLYFWKVLYDSSTFRATVFFTVNNPHLQDVGNYILCDDISDQISWLTWESHNATKGYSYACTYQDAKNIISYLPPLYVEQILT